MALGRPRTEIDEEQLTDLLIQGWTKKDAAQELGVSTPTLRNRIADLQKKEGLILQYRALQSLELTEIEAQVLESITPEKIRGASLKDLVTAFKILKDKELVSEGRPSEIKGLVGYLVQLEKEEATAKKQSVTNTADSIEAEVVERSPSVEELSQAIKESEEELLAEESDEEDSLTLLPQLLNQSAGKETGDNTSVGETLFPLEDLPDL